MKRIKIIITIVLVSMLSFAFTSKQSNLDFSGKWKTQKGQIVLISKTATGFIGTSLDKKTTILKDIKLDNGKWKGIIQKPNSKDSAVCELELKDDKLVITAKKGFLSKTIEWTRP